MERQCRFLARIINTRAELNWDVPIVGQTTLGSGQTKALLAKPEHWEKVYPNNFRNLSYNAQGQLPPQSAEFVERLRKAKVDFADTLLWWVALGYDGPRLIAEALREAGTAPADITAYWNTKVKGWKGVYGTIVWSPDNHDGFQQEEIIMVQANSLKDGAFKLAPGYA